MSNKAVVAARKAFPIWSKKSQADRSAIAMKIAAMLRDNAQELGKLDTLDHGSPAQRAAFLPTASSLNFEWAAYNCRSLMGHTIPSTSEDLIYLQREPIGVIAIITPWNVPADDGGGEIGSRFDTRQYLHHQAAQHRFTGSSQICRNAGYDWDCLPAQ